MSSDRPEPHGFRLGRAWLKQLARKPSADLLDAIATVIDRRDIPAWLDTPMPWLEGRTPRGHIREHREERIWAEIEGPREGGGW